MLETNRHKREKARANWELLPVALGLTFLALLVGSLAVTVNVAAQVTSPRLKNVILFYDDYPFSGNPNSQITKEIARPLVAYVTADGKVVDWMFDTFIFYTDRLHNDMKPTQKFIDAWIKYLFDSRQIALLDTTVGDAKTALGRPDYQLKILLTVPVVFNDMSATSIQRNIDTLLRRWRAAAPANLKLVGFYWGFTESLWLKGVDKAISSTASYLHSKGFKLLMIPYLNAVGAEKLHSLGVDYVTMQPNYAWDEKSDLNAFKTTNSYISAGLSDGVEFELPTEVDSLLKCCGRDWRVNLNTYFDQANTYNWKTRLATYYYGGAVYLMGTRTSSDYRTAYETIYHYIQASMAYY